LENKTNVGEVKSMNRKKILIVLLSLVLCLTVSTVALANASKGDLQQVIGSETTSTFAQKAANVVNAIKAPVQIAAVTIALLLVVFRGLILTAVQDEQQKARIGRAFLWTFIGLGLVFFGIQIASVIINNLATAAGIK